MPLYNDPYADGLHEAVIDLMKLPEIRSYVLKIKSTRSLFDAYYQVLVKKEELRPLEDMPLHYKQKIWAMTLPVEEKEERTKAARAIYLIDKINLEV